MRGFAFLLSCSGDAVVDAAHAWVRTRTLLLVFEYYSHRWCCQHALRGIVCLFVRWLAWRIALFVAVRLRVQFEVFYAETLRALQQVALEDRHVMSMVRRVQCCLAPIGVVRVCAHARRT